MAGPIRTCLILRGREADTLGLVRALHRADLAVLERPITPSTVAMAGSGEFDLVCLLCEGRDQIDLIAPLSSRTPVLAVWREPTAAQVAMSLMAGADACLQRDADEDVVVAQAHAILRRQPPHAPPTAELGILRVGDLLVDLDRCEVERAGQTIPLTPSEFRIIEYLARNAGRVCAAHEILNACSRDYEYRPTEAREVFKVYARRIRRKLDPGETEQSHLITVRGFGYRLAGHHRQGRLALVV